MIRINIVETEKEINELRSRLFKTTSQSLRNGIFEKMSNLQAMQQEFIVPNDEFNKLNRDYKNGRY